MAPDLDRFEIIARNASSWSDAEPHSFVQHPFESRAIHEALPQTVRALFDDGHYSQATFEAYKFVDREVQRHAGVTDSGKSLMMRAFNEVSPLIALTARSGTSERDEQEGYKFLFAGAVLAIRHPRGHEYAVVDSPDDCLDHLAFASMLLRRLSDSGYNPVAD